MKYSKDFIGANARLETLDQETLNDELNKMTTDELLKHADCMLQQKLGEENLLSEEEAQAEVDRLLQLTREPTENEIEPLNRKPHRTGRRIIVLIAAILLVVSVFSVAVVASKRDFSILNGVVSFENGKIHVRFPREDEAVFMTVEELEADLNTHGFEDVKLPEYFYEGEWQVKSIGYYTEEGLNEASISANDGYESYSIIINLYSDPDFSRDNTFLGAEGGKTIQKGNVSIYLFEYGNNRCGLVYFIDNKKYEIKTVSTIEKMIKIAETVA